MLRICERKMMYSRTASEIEIYILSHYFSGRKCGNDMGGKFHVFKAFVIETNIVLTICTGKESNHLLHIILKSLMYIQTRMHRNKRSPSKNKARRIDAHMPWI